MSRETGNRFVRRRWLWATALVAPAALTLAWVVGSSGSATGETGVVRIAGGTPPPAIVPPPTPAATRAAPLTPQRNSQLADEDHYLVLREQRDRAWADRSEAAILGQLRSLAEVDRASLAVKCTTSVCEATGLAVEDPASGSMAPTWDALDRESAADTLGSQGLERAATVFGTGRVREAFAIHYRRTAAAAR